LPEPSASHLGCFAMKVLLVEPAFPVPKKSRNHKNFLPIGLLKIYNYQRSIGNRAKLVRGKKSKREIGSRFTPERILITSLFTYWSEYVWDTVSHYRQNYPDADIVIGGIYASLMGGSPHFRDRLKRYRARVFMGVDPDVEEYVSENLLDYSVLGEDNGVTCQIVHSTRGCSRRCRFCGTWKIEPKFESKDSVRKELNRRKVVFYDNNLLANPHIGKILDELSIMKKTGEIDTCESQSGFDGRMLNPELAAAIRRAGFVNPKIAWDGPYDDWPKIESQITLLRKVGYNSKEISVFVLYNWRIPFEEVEKKRLKCWTWKVQISDCRFRPLTQLHDRFDSKKSQTERDYYIHDNWTDEGIKQFRRKVRRQNICVRHSFPFYSRELERKLVSRKQSLRFRKMPRDAARKILPDIWYPDESEPYRPTDGRTG